MHRTEIKFFGEVFGVCEFQTKSRISCGVLVTRLFPQKPTEAKTHHRKCSVQMVLE